MTKQLACIYLYFENIMMIEVYTMGLYWQCFIHSVRVLVKWHIHGVTFMSFCLQKVPLPPCGDSMLYQYYVVCTYKLSCAELHQSKF